MGGKVVWETKVLFVFPSFEERDRSNKRNEHNKEKKSSQTIHNTRKEEEGEEERGK